MAKGNPWDDAFEQLAELGRSTVKHTVKSVGETFDPRKMIENSLGKNDKSNEAMQKEMKELQEKKPNATPLDFAKLQQKYDAQDKTKTDALRNRLFQMVKSGEEKVQTEKKQKEAEGEQQKAYAQEEQRRRQQEKQRQQTAVNPQGKERKSIMGGKKKKKGVEPSPAEIKPSTGKQ